MDGFQVKKFGFSTPKKDLNSGSLVAELHVAD